MELNDGINGEWKDFYEYKGFFMGKTDVKKEKLCAEYQGEVKKHGIMTRGFNLSTTAGQT